jgi:plastocyanin
MLRRLLTGMAAVVLLAACGSDIQTPANQADPAGQAEAAGVKGTTVTFKETEYSLAPDTLTLKPGTYTFKLQDVGQFPHDLHVAVSSNGSEVGGSTVITENQSTSFTVTLKPGVYTVWCAVNAHRSLGMQGTITVK